MSVADSANNASTPEPCQPAVKQCSRCHETLPADEFWRNKAMADGRHGSCKVCNKATGERYPEDDEPSKENWDGVTTYSQRPPLLSVYYGSCLSSGHESGAWSLTRQQAYVRRLVGLPSCAICGSIVFLTEDSDGFRGAGVQRHHSPSQVEDRRARGVTLRVVGFCPVHHPEDNCSQTCVAVRARFARLAWQLGCYWRDRKRGVRPLAEYRRRQRRVAA